MVKNKTCEQCENYQRCYVNWVPRPFKYIGIGYCKCTFKSRRGKNKACKKHFIEKK
ncbi:Uncharacterised protein [Clostridium carnis]|uniref:Uncharacterized protein n=1 Tax=Clostridium carnis TaxID=1530 RepID=A0ABY6T0Z6_9CLOT|nr:hypothetical protein [Clostridium carnis]VDG74682.1 Uncharacterised protein [Clostridium carnis]